MLNAYSGDYFTRTLQPYQTFEDELSLKTFHNWCDVIVTVPEDPTFSYRLAGHIETGKDSFTDPALGGLVKLKA